MKEYLILLSSIRYDNKKTDPNRADRVESIVREWFLKNANKLRLSNRTSRITNLSLKNFSFFKKEGHKDDPKLQNTLASLGSDFIEKITNNERYHTKQGRPQTHYFYRISQKIKDWLNGSTLIWMVFYDPHFYSLEDPSFYKDDHLLGHIISHEGYIYLYLKPDEYNNLIQLGLKPRDFLDLPPH